MVDKQTMQNITEASAAKWRRLHELEAEVARLREALTFIKGLKPGPVAEGFKTGPQALLNAAQREARAALQERLGDGKTKP
ncbi:MAG: hypothetical protein OEQ39_04390 [Gammaproteobacteria bacterium]|nr:hypothetical protein [Gammaproteobacteria bacterium]